jgi:hypothetical protein
MEVSCRFHAPVAVLAGKELVVLSRRLGITHNPLGVIAKRTSLPGIE